MSTSYGSEVEVLLRGQTVLIDDIQLGAPEFDVGIMGYYVDGYKLYDSEGKELDWDLTEEESKLVDDKLAEALKNYSGPEYYEDLE